MARSGSTKRKRNTSPGEKANKQLRMEEEVCEGRVEGDEGLKMLQVLEESDSLGLLDRVFPPSLTFSLRSLLQHSQQHSLSVLRTAIHHLQPLAAHPRSRPSETASQQLHFCTLALSLLDQASTNTPLPSPSPRYALLQHLPSGNYWSSLSQKKIFPTTAHAELVSILPTPSNNLSQSTLASYTPQKSHSIKPIPPQRRLTAASFLDYGPWASFAPSFDHDCQLVGRRELGQVLWHKQAKREAQLRDWIDTNCIDTDDTPHSSEPIDVQAHFDGILPPDDIQNLKAALDNADLENLVDELLTRNRRALLRLQDLQIDRLTSKDVSTSLDESSEEWQIAHGILESLETLTSLRPRTSSGHFLSVIPPTSVLRKLHKTLALEPRPGWHGTLPSTRATALRDDSTVKVRASTAQTVTTASTSSSPAPTSITPAASTTTAPTTTPYTGYTYAYSTQQAQAYRPAGTAVASTTYTPYKTGPTSYYQNYLQGAAQQQQQYYGQQAYGVGATNQQPYAAYTNWFAHAHQYAASAAAANVASTGRGTPQPATAATAYSAYYQQQPAAAAQPTQQRIATATASTTPAVANTVATSKTANPGVAGATSVWGNYVAGQQPTLPARTPTTTASTTATPVTTTPAANGYQPTQQQNYYGAYQAPQQQTQSQPTTR